MSNIEINGCSLEYMVSGRGDPLILVHGSASDYRTWYKQQEVFAKNYRVINYSRRYHWPNAAIANGADYAMQDHVADLQELIQKLNSAAAHLVGHSYGAFVCLLLAIKQPQLVRSLVLAEPPVITLFISNNPKPAELLKLFVKKPRCAAAFVKFGAKGVTPARKAAKKDQLIKAQHLFGRAIMGNGYFERMSRERMQQVDANAIKAEFLGSGFPAIEKHKLQNMSAAALFISAEESNRLFHCITNRLRQLIPQSQYAEIEQASHLMHEDNAKAYNRVVMSFLKKNT